MADVEKGAKPAGYLELGGGGRERRQYPFRIELAIACRQTGVSVSYIVALVVHKPRLSTKCAWLRRRVSPTSPMPEMLSVETLASKDMKVPVIQATI